MCKSFNYYPVYLMQMKNGSISFYCGQWGVLESKGWETLDTRHWNNMNIEAVGDDQSNAQETTTSIAFCSSASFTESKVPLKAF